MAVAAGVLWPSSVLAAGIGSRPANPDSNNPRTQSIFIYQLNRGASKSDQLTITNGLTEQANIEVYAVDGTVTATGDMTCKQQVEAKKRCWQLGKISEKRGGFGAWHIDER